MAFEITNRNEYVALKTCVTLYEMLESIVKDKNEITEMKVKTHINLLTIKLNKVEKFLNLKLKLKNSILMSLQVSFNAASEIHNEFLENIEVKEPCFEKAIKLAYEYCEGYKEVFLDWLNATEQYERLYLEEIYEEKEENQDDGDKRLQKILFLLALLGGLSIFTYASLYTWKNKDNKKLEVGYEDGIDYDNTSIEKVDVEQILARKL